MPNSDGVIDDPDREVVSTRRLEAFTDGVFAIAATILVLDLTAEGLGAIRSEGDMWAGLASTLPTLLSVAVSFLLLGLLWIIHLRQFEFVDRVDSNLLWLNLLRLLGVVVVPFSTSVNNEYSDFLAGRLVLPVNILVIMVFGTWQWFYATSARRGLVGTLSARAVHNTRVNSATALVLSVVVVVLATAVGSFAFILFFASPLIEAVQRRMGVLWAADAPRREGDASAS